MKCQEIDNPENVTTFTINYPDDYHLNNGEYNECICDIPAGKYKVTAIASGYETSYPNYEVTIGENEAVELEIDFVKSGEEAVRGQNFYITDSVTGTPLEDVTIKYAHFYSNHDDMSECRVETFGAEYKGYYYIVLEEGFYTLALEKEGYETLYIDEYLHEYATISEIGYQMKPTNETTGDGTGNSEAVYSFTYNGHKYCVYDDALEWEEAKEKCLERGGYMAILDSAEENDAVYKELENFDYVCVYFGLEKVGDVWYWSDGSEASFTNWEPGEPNNQGAVECYASFYYRFWNNTWNDAAFVNDNPRYYLCEFDVVEEEPEHWQDTSVD